MGQFDLLEQLMAHSSMGGSTSRQSLGILLTHRILVQKYRMILLRRLAMLGLTAVVSH